MRNIILRVRVKKSISVPEKRRKEKRRKNGNKKYRNWQGVGQISDIKIIKKEIKISGQNQRINKF